MCYTIRCTNMCVCPSRAWFAINYTHSMTGRRVIRHKQLNINSSKTQTLTVHTHNPRTALIEDVSFVVVVYSWAHSTHAAPQSYHPSFCVTQRVDPISQSPFARWCGTIGTRPGWICMCDANYSAHSAHSIFHTARARSQPLPMHISSCVCVCRCCIVRQIRDARAARAQGVSARQIENVYSILWCSLVLDRDSISFYSKKTYNFATLCAQRGYKFNELLSARARIYVTRGRTPTHRTLYI